MVILAVALALLVGVSLGLLGGGGSILAVPLLVYVAGLGAHQAVATSLFVVEVTSAVGLVPHARAGRVRWRTGLVFGVGGDDRRICRWPVGGPGPWWGVVDRLCGDDARQAARQ